MKHFIETLHIFSGRPNPTWTLKNHEWVFLKSVWNRLSQCSAQDINPPGLGYHGISAEHENHESFFTFQGDVSRESSEEIEWCKDPTHEFEQYLLSTRPDKIVPDELLSQLTGKNPI
jgi:hypothetical protein